MMNLRASGRRGGHKVHDKPRRGRPLTLKEAKNLKRDQVLYHRTYRNSDGTAQRWRVSGKPHTWKRDPKRVSVPVKHGLYDHDHLDEHSLHLVSRKDPTGGH